MAKKKVVVRPQLFTFEVVSDKVDKMLGPYKVIDEVNRRVVQLTEKQAKWYVDQGMIAAT